jgi:DNA-binding NarL/FixJ family response regulator
VETPATILIAEDHLIVREGLRNLLSTDPNLKVIGEAIDGCEAVTLALKLRPEIVVMDIAMPRLNGMDATRLILQSLPNTRILILSAHDDPTCIEHVRLAGASGYLLKQASFKEFLRAIYLIMKPVAFVGPGLTEQPAASENKRSRLEHAPSLTPREGQVLQLIATGLMNKQIAGELSISIKTVEKHRQRIMDKLDIHNTAGLTQHAMISGLVGCNVQLKVIV